MKWPFKLLLFLTLVSNVSGKTSDLGQANGDDCDGACSQGQASGGEGAGVLVAALGPIANVPVLSEGLNNSICGMAAGSSWTEFNDYLTRNNLLLENVVGGARCTIGDFSKRPARFLHRTVVSNSGIVSMVQQISRYLLRNKKTDIFVGLVKGLDDQPDLFTELQGVWDNSSPDQKNSVVAAARMLCATIKNRRGQIDSLMDLYNQRCIKGPLSIDNV